MHKTEAKGSNIAYAFKMMINSVDYVLGGTGTLFGGKSTDLFFLLHRINHEVRKRFGSTRRVPGRPPTAASR